MKNTSHKLSFIAVMAFLVSAAWSLDYVWLTDSETTVNGDRIPFGHGDTLYGMVRSNDQFAIMEDPVFYGQMISSAPDFWHGPGYNPQFLGPPPIFNASEMRIATRLEIIRQQAANQGHFYGEPGMQIMVNLRGSSITCFYWPVGIPMDSSYNWQILITMSTCVFFDCPIHIQGIVQGRLWIGSSGRISIDDNVRYIDADPRTGVTPENSLNLLALATEDEIKISNTPANGRWNSGGEGWSQQNPDSTNIVITAALYALGGSFTFEQQNDPDSGYVCDCQPDDRGMVYIYGGIVQRERGYLHRSNLGSTGYQMQLRYDPRLAQWDDFVDDRPRAETDTIAFGEVIVGTTAWDTVEIDARSWGYLGAVYATQPFHAVRNPPFYGYYFDIPVSFTPPRVAPFHGDLTVCIDDHILQIVLLGRGVSGEPPIILNVAPNPFNLSTTIHYELAEPATVRLLLYDILGRTAKQVDLSNQSPGTHSYFLDASDLASGVYFVSLNAGKQTATQKILLLK